MNRPKMSRNNSANLQNLNKCLASHSVHTAIMVYTHRHNRHTQNSHPPAQTQDTHTTHTQRTHNTHTQHTTHTGYSLWLQNESLLPWHYCSDLISHSVTGSAMMECFRLAPFLETQKVLSQLRGLWGHVIRHHNSVK